MFKAKSRVYFLYLLIDVTFITLSFYLPFRFNADLVPHYSAGIKSYLSAYFFWSAILLFFLHNFLLYYTDRYLSIFDEWLKVVKCVLFSSILTALFLYILKIDIFSRLVFLESTLALLLTLSVWRTIKRAYVRYLVQRGYANYNILVIGAGTIGVALIEEIKAFPYLGIRPIGFLDDTKTGQVNGIQILGRVSELEQIANKYFIDEIYVTIPSERKIAGEIIQKGAKLGKTVRIVAEHFNMPYRQVQLNYIGAVPLMTYFEKAGHRVEDSIIKRSMDILVSLLLMVFLLPLFIIIAILIKMESPGPVFYISRRSGKKGISFDLYKFRSMVKDADSYKQTLRSKSEVEGPIFKIRNDPRLTRIGKILRKYSLDELPQLINVSRGDMSLVGPRPFPVEESDAIEYNHIPRLNIKPGITGLAQVKGRSDLKFNNWMRWDIWYVENWTLGLDMKILLWTIPAVLKGKGAY